MCSVPIKYMYIVIDSNPLEQPSSNDVHRLVSLNLTEGQSVPVRCVTSGGHPAPELSVTIDDRDITSQFETTHVTDVIGQRGLRTVHFRSSCWTPSFMVTSDDHGKYLRCTALVPGIKEPSTANVSLLVNCKYTSESHDLHERLTCSYLFIPLYIARHSFEYF